MSEWKTPGKRTIQLASANSRQVAISLSGGEIIYFELDAAGQLIEMGAVDMGKEVTALDVGTVPEGRARSMFLAVGCVNDSVQLLSLDPSDVFGKGPEFAVGSRPTALCLVEMVKDAPTSSSGSAEASSSSVAVTSLYLHVGLEKGVLLRVAVDPITGDFSDARQKFLGPKPIKLCRVNVHGQAAVMALTTRAWVMYNYQNRYFQDPLSYEMLEHVSNFSSEACPNGIVAVAGNTLRIINIDTLGALFNQTTHPLRYTPRKMCRVPGSTQLVILESDHNEYNEAERLELARIASQIAIESGDSLSMEIASKTEEEDDGATVIPVRGPVPPADGKWASCIRVIEPLSGVTKGLLELQNNEAAFSVCTCKFNQHSEETFVVVGTAKDLTLHPRRFGSCSIHVYRLLDGALQLLHSTEVDDIPLAMVEFGGRLLVGVGRCLRLYDLGKKKLLKKCENKSLPTAIVRLQVMGERIFVGDLAESVQFVKYKKAENVLSVFADDTAPR
jgi:splicing factor 3B subunit 3